MRDSRTHLDDGQIAALLGNGLPAEERTASAEHLSLCSVCRGRADELAAIEARVDARLASLASAEAPANAAVALRRFHTQYDRQEEDSVFNRIFAKPLRPFWAMLLVVALLAGSMTFDPVRAWAGQFLGLFRVQSVEVLPVDPTLMDQLTGNSALSTQIGQLLSHSVTFTKKPTKPQLVSGTADASKLAGFQVRLPTSRSDAPQLLVSGGSAFQFVVDRKLAQSVVDQMGRSDIQLPASLDGATIKATIPAGLSAAYGDCPQGEELTGEAGSAGSPRRRFQNCVILAEIPSPTVDTPPDLDVQKLAELGLEISGMNAQQAHSYAQAVDWTSTLVIPVPRNAASYKEVQVDGVTGYLIQRPVDDAPQYALIWVNKGIIYAIGGMGSNTASAIQMANSLR